MSAWRLRSLLAAALRTQPVSPGQRMWRKKLTGVKLCSQLKSQGEQLRADVGATLDRHSPLAHCVLVISANGADRFLLDVLEADVVQDVAIRLGHGETVCKVRYGAIGILLCTSKHARTCYKCEDGY
jgi:hypothetical protein